MTMFNKSIRGIILIVCLVLAISCSDDSDSNPTSPQQVNYKGLNSMNKEVLLAIIGDKVTGYSIMFQINTSDGTQSGTRAQTDTDGLATITSNQFEINLETNEVITGTIAGNTITGTFILNTGRTVNNKPETVNGTYTVQEL